ncbi:general stress protein [Ancylobacter sp. 3268]|uniref:general stress protein n=1 Tax=Ancylobacter sp. 3268 TaxID=2817752 RepID=UPI003857E732
MANTQHRGGSGNFANDRERASEAGRKGGEHSQGGQQHTQSAGDGRQQGGQREHSGNVANDKDRARDAGHKGGQR